MSPSAPTPHNGIAALQIPAAGTLNVDHVAHFVPDMDAASAALERLGFTLTPYSAQSHRVVPGGPLVPAGTANRCIMLERGYLEILTPTADTPVANQLRDALRRYTGVQLIAFGTATAEADHARLASEGFEPLAPVALQRPIGTESGQATARFTVVRVPPGTMPEGRVQFCHQLTPELVWQSRWHTHANGATALACVLVCVADAEAAARRYGRYTGLMPTRTVNAWEIATARGTLLFATPQTLERVLGVCPPVVPWIAGYVLESRDHAACRELAASAQSEARELDDDHFMLTLPPALGGILVFERRESAPLRFP